MLGASIASGYEFFGLYNHRPLVASGDIAAAVTMLGGAHSRAFANPAVFSQLLKEAADASRLDLKPLVIPSFSAGYGAVREILKNRDNWRRIEDIILEDSLHTSYVPEGRPGPLDTATLQPFVDFAREAAAGRKRMLITNSEIFPGTFASTTETTNYIVEQLGQQTSEVRMGRFRLMGFAGSTAPDHVDHLHGLATWLRILSR
jgi:hypothetical protein